MLTQFLKQSVKEVQLPAPQIGLRESVKNSSSSSTGDGLKKSLVLELTLTCFTVYDEYGCNLSAKCCTRAGELPLSGCRHSQVAYSLNFKMGPNQVKMEIFHSQIIPSASLSNWEFRHSLGVKQRLANHICLYSLFGCCCSNIAPNPTGNTYVVKQVFPPRWWYTNTGVWGWWHHGISTVEGLCWSAPHENFFFPVS